MSEEHYNIWKNAISEFIDRVYPVLVKLDSSGFTGLKIAAVKDMSNLILKHGDLLWRKPPELANIPRAVQQAIQGDNKSKYALAVLTNNIVGGVFAFNTIVDIANIIGGSTSQGIEELNKIFVEPPASELERTTWYRSLYVNILYSLHFGLLWQIIRDYFMECLPSNPYYHIENILRSILLDLEITRSTHSVPFDLEYLYDFFIAETPRISRPVDQVINNMERYGKPYYFTTTKVEPRVLLLSLVLYYCYSGEKFDLKPLDPLNPRGEHLILIEPLADVIRETWKKFKPIDADTVIEYVKAKKPVMSQTRPGYAKFTLMKPYADFFETIEGVMKGKPKDEKWVIEGLMKTAVPFLMRLYPFIMASWDGRTIIIEGETRGGALNLLETLAFASSFSATCAVQLLSGVHAWRRLTKSSTSALSRILRRAATASFDPFLPPEAMIRHTLLVADAMLFKVTNALYEMTGMSDLVFEPTENLEEDLLRMWEMLPPESRAKLGVGDLDPLKRLLMKTREPYDLFVRIQKTPLEWCSVYITKLFLEIERGMRR
jgi:hypothetical protein